MFLIVSALILLTSFCVSLNLKKGIPYALVIVSNFTILTIYVAGWMHQLSLCIFIFGIGIVYEIVKIIRNNSEEIWANISYMGIVVFSLFAILTFVYNRGMRVWAGDDLAHWALVVKEMFYHEHFYGGSGSIVTYVSYPPGMACWEWLFERANNHFTDEILFQSHQLYIFISLMPLFGLLEEKSKTDNNVLKKEKIGRVVFLFVFCILLPFVISDGLFSYSMYTTLQVDGILGILFAVTFLIWIIGVHDIASMLLIGSNLMVMGIIKETGLAFSFLFLFIVLINWIKSRKKDAQEKNIITKNTMYIVAFTVLSVLVGQSWKVYLAINKVIQKVPSQDKRFSIETLKKLLVHHEEAYRYQTISLFINKIVGPINFGMIQVSYLGFILVCLAVFMIINARKTSFRSSGEIFSLVYFVFFVIWESGILYLYLYKFHSSEALSLNAFNRYFQPCLYGVLIPAIYMVIYYSSGRVIGIVLFCLSLTIYPESFKRNISIKDRVYASEVSHPQLVKSISDYSFDTDDKVYIIAQQGEYLITAYDFCPVQTNRLFYTGNSGDYRVTYKLGKKDGEEDFHTLKISDSKFREILQKYTYVYIASSDDAFREEYSEVFESKISDKTLYAVETVNNTIKLRKVR